MGITDGAKLLRESNERSDNVEDLKGQTLGIDIMIWLYSAARSTLGSEQYHAKPPVPVTAVVASLTPVLVVAW